MTAAKTRLPVLGVPVQSKALSGMDSLLSIVQMPKGIPVGTLAIGEAGAVERGAARRGDRRARTIPRSPTSSTRIARRRPQRVLGETLP